MRKYLLKEGKYHVKPRIFALKSAVLSPFIITPLNEKKIEIYPEKDFNLKQNTEGARTGAHNNLEFSRKHFRSKYCKQSKVSEYVSIRYKGLSDNPIHRYNETEIATPAEYVQHDFSKSNINTYKKLNRIYVSSVKPVKRAALSSLSKVKKMFS